MKDWKDEYNHIQERKLKLEKSKNKIIKEYNNRIDKINQYIKVLEKSKIKKHDNVETKIYKLYMQLDNVTSVANKINNMDYRISTNSKKGKRKYTTNDITYVITNKEAIVEKELKEVVQEIQKINYGKQGKRWF